MPTSAKQVNLFTKNSSTRIARAGDGLARDVKAFKGHITVKQAKPAKGESFFENRLGLMSSLRKNLKP